MNKKSPTKKGISKEVSADLIDAAKRARANSYAPYSNYRVGSALLTKSGKIFAGCNFENACYGACICAERNAIGQMVAAGEREPIACVVITGGKRPGSPCGICLQVLSEFAKDMPIVLIGEYRGGETRRDTSLATMLPDVFVLEK